jgi:hypothetical protein
MTGFYWGIKTQMVIPMGTSSDSSSEIMKAKHSEKLMATRIPRD